MRNRRLKSIALFSGSFFLLLLLLFSAHIYALSGLTSSVEPGIRKAGLFAGTAGRPFISGTGFSVSVPHPNQHSRMNGKAGHSDKRHFETDLFAGANKAGVPAASQALISD